MMLNFSIKSTCPFIEYLKPTVSRLYHQLASTSPINSLGNGMYLSSVGDLELKRKPKEISNQVNQ